MECQILFARLTNRLVSMHVDVLGLTLDSSSKDFVNGKVVGVNHDLYMKGCVKDVSQGIKVGY